jgi:hypothetical protein
MSTVAVSGAKGMLERPWNEDAQLILSPSPGLEGLGAPREEAKEWDGGVGMAAERDGSISVTSGPEEMAAWGSTGLVEVSVTGRGLEGPAAVVVVRGLGFHCVVFGFAAVVEAVREKGGIWEEGAEGRREEEDRRGRRSWRARDRMVAVLWWWFVEGRDVDGC